MQLSIFPVFLSFPNQFFRKKAIFDPIPQSQAVKNCKKMIRHRPAHEFQLKKINSKSAPPFNSIPQPVADKNCNLNEKNWKSGTKKSIFLIYYWYFFNKKLQFFEKIAIFINFLRKIDYFLVFLCNFCKKLTKNCNFSKKMQKIAKKLKKLGFGLKFWGFGLIFWVCRVSEPVSALQSLSHWLMSGLRPPCNPRGGGGIHQEVDPK